MEASPSRQAAGAILRASQWKTGFPVADIVDPAVEPIWDEGDSGPKSLADDVAA